MGEATKVFRVVVRSDLGPEPWRWKPTEDLWNDETAEADENRTFASWADSGDGYHEPRESYVTTDHKDGRPYFVIPRRRRYFDATAARRLAERLCRFGLDAVVEQGHITWPAAADRERGDG